MPKVQGARGQRLETVRPAAPPVGRPPVTSRAELERVAFGLFGQRGFESVTVRDISSAAGIGVRTFFRYYQSKNDVVWGDFQAELERFRASLAAVDRAVPLGRGLVESIVAFNTYPEQEAPRHRQRMELILTVPELQAHSTLQYGAWRDAVAGFVASRTGGRPEDLEPQVVARTALGAAVAAYDRWLELDEQPLVGVMRTALELWAKGLDLRSRARRPGGQS